MNRKIRRALFAHDMQRFTTHHLEVIKRLEREQ